MATSGNLTCSPCNTSRDLCADKGYINGNRETRLTSEGSRRMHIQRKGNKEKPLSGRKSGATARIAKPRATLHLNWKVTAYNCAAFSTSWEKRAVLTLKVRPECRNWRFRWRDG